MRREALTNLLSLPGINRWRHWGWWVVKRTIQTKFPQVQHISAETLATWLAQPAATKPLLLDTRTEAEYAVSHLPGAQRVEPQDLSSLKLPSQDTPVVTYCSVGYRSAAIAERLQASGYTNVHNLEGSIFQWANQGQLVCRKGEPVRQVHPYNSVWGRLLSEELHAYEVPSPSQLSDPD